MIKNQKIIYLTINLDLCSNLCMGILNPSRRILCDERLKMKKIYKVNLLMREIFVSGTNTHKPEKKATVVSMEVGNLSKRDDYHIFVRASQDIVVLWILPTGFVDSVV